MKWTCHEHDVENMNMLKCHGKLEMYQELTLEMNVGCVKMWVQPQMKMVKGSEDDAVMKI